MDGRPNLLRRAAAEGIGALAYQLVRGAPTTGRRAENGTMPPVSGPQAEVEA